MKKIISFVGLLLSSLAIFGQVNYEPNVMVSTFAGGSFADGQGTAAKFYNPSSVCVDASGNVYVADYSNNRIRKISPSGLVSTLAGSGSFGSADGQGVAASFKSPKGVCVDASGNVYVADKGNYSIRKISPSGLVSTLAGGGQDAADGQGKSASFYYPTSVCVDVSGNVYVADIYNNKIRKISPSGLVSTLAGLGFSDYIGGSTDGKGTVASFYNPCGVCVDASGNVYVADNGNNKIRKISPSGLVTTLAGSNAYGSADGQGTDARFQSPSGVCVDALGNVYVADYNKIRKISPSGLVTTLAGYNAYGSADGQGAAARFQSPVGVCVDASGNVYVADNGNHKIRKISPNGLVSTLAGSGTQGSVDGEGMSANFSSLEGICVDSSGNVYVADAGNHNFSSNKIRKISTFSK